MRSPFPGMDPYLEDPIFWSEFHSRLIMTISTSLLPQLLPHYYIGIETRTYLDGTDEALLIGIPDAVILATQNAPSPKPSRISTATQVRPQQVQIPLPRPIEIKERYLEVREAETNAVITVIEVLSPSNKRKGKGRSDYEAKRRKILHTDSHLIEIDLLRSDEPITMSGAMPLDYHVLVSRSPDRPTADLYAFKLQEPIPTFPLPLRELDETIDFDLQAIVNKTYAEGAYSIRLNYQNPVPPPALSETDRIWVQELLK